MNKISKPALGNLRPRSNALRAVIWFLVFGACGIYGYLGPGRSAAQGGGGSFDAHTALEVTICFLAFGAGLATCVVVGMTAVAQLRTKQTIEVLAALFIRMVCAPVLTGFLLWLCRQIKPLDFFQEEEALLAVGGIVFWTMEAAAASFVVFTAIILATKAKPASR